MIIVLETGIEKIRQHLGIERWQVFGGSWGSALALGYSESHRRVTELVLRGIFLLRKIDWIYQRGASVLYPDAKRRPTEDEPSLGNYSVRRALAGSMDAARRAGAGEQR